MAGVLAQTPQSAPLFAPPLPSRNPRRNPRRYSRRSVFHSSKKRIASSRDHTMRLR